MKRIAWLFGLSVLGVSLAAWASTFLLAPSGESLTLDCRSDGLYIGYQLDGLPACGEFACMTVRARTDSGAWVQYSAHNGSNMGFVRNKRSTFRKNGALAESLLERMLKASSVELLNPSTGKAVAFPISDADRAELKALVAKCGS